ncbi:MAG TPA: penicillin-binding transpeptidase domain-containing protein, partial [Actinomycetota bacterium]|nr:penicillin-binding transpeptidase domain-containing protein [Actinomycetota bacterium]
VVYLRHRPLNTAAAVSSAFLKDWGAQDYAGMKTLVRHPPADFAGTYTQAVSDLQVTAVTATGVALHQSGIAADESARVNLALRGLGQWSYAVTIHLSERARRWLVDWTPAALQPQLVAGERFTRVLTWPQRAAILGEGGTPLRQTVQGWSVGVEPAKVTNLTAVENAFNQVLQVPTSTVTTALHTPGAQPTWFLPVTQISPQQFTSVQPQLSPVPGILFEQSTARVTYAPGAAQAVLGTTGPVTAQLLGQLGAPYASGDTVGLSGLELAYERQLAGTPSADIDLKNASGTVVGSSLMHFDGTPGTPVVTTIDPTVQSAAESALTGLTKNAALVAVDAATGQIRAIANNPPGGFDRALDGTYPPGSTMKIITSYALFSNGDSLTTPISCPTQTVVDGKTFKNIEGEATGNIDLQQAFVESCNTAFVQMTETLTPSQLTKAADTFGFNAPEPLGIASAGASFPPMKDIVDQAGAAIGQAEVLTSPVHMASVAAAVASGAWHEPTLLAADQATATVTPLDPTIAANLRTMMGLVVTQGTGVAAQLPGTPVFGKTGTAEFGSGNPPQTHAWFIGFRGQLAFAVIVEAGGVGGKVAAPLAAKFLSLVPGS